MAYEEDFETGEVVDLRIEGYPKDSWTYKPATAAEENSWLKEYTSVSENGVEQDFEILNKIKMSRLVSVPYEKEHIVKHLNIDKEWSELNADAKWIFLGKLKPGVFDKILNAINDLKNDKIKKNSDQKSQEQTQT
jgi:hypothetical protein